LLRVEFGQLQRSIDARLQLGNLLVHRDALDRETLRGISIAHNLETLDSVRGVSQAGVEIANRVRNREVLVVVFADLFVLSNGVLQLALLDKFLRGAEDFLFF
jgi:hypothetical protein